MVVARSGTATLKRKASRWQTLPRPDDDSSTIDVDDKRYSLLLFLRDLKMSQEHWEAFLTALKDAPGLLDETSIGARMVDAILRIQRIDHDYIDPEAPSAKKRRIDIVGNSAAATHLTEYNELIKLARTIWTNPDDLSDIMGDLYQNYLGQRPGDAKFSLENVFQMARSWGEVRYRFMNHALRDDPNLGPSYNTGRRLAKGNAANAIVHESNVLLDSKMVEFRALNNTGYTPQDRAIFQELYLLTPEEGRQLIEYSGPTTGLRIGLPQVFGYCVSFINALIDWRVQVLEASRKQVMSSGAYRNASAQAAKQNILAGRHSTNSTRLASVDNPYINDFVPVLRQLLEEAKSQNALVRPTFDKLEGAVRTLITGVKNSPMNIASLRNNPHFSRMVNAFPGPITLTRPTGTSLAAAPRPLPARTPAR
ncbi:hypothetical protein F4824DRAFT_481562 [Ustulina deusta]|nr:hypothetical protein F4824DRAFT_481562 [Ustulina deusta]